MWGILNYLKLFFLELLLAIKYAALEYDDKLRQTKTNLQRFFIWLAIFSVSLIGIYIVLRFVGGAILSVTKNYDKIIPE